MPGKFHFALTNAAAFDRAAYLAAIHATRKMRPPPDLYVSYGPVDMGMAMVVKSQQRHEWSLVLPTDPQKYDLECGLTYGITSRRETWEYIRAVLVAVCRSNPDAFVLSYEDHDLGDGVYEHGVYDKQAQELVVRHKGLPTAAEFEGASAPRPGGGGGGGGRGGTAQGAADGSATCDGPEKKHAVAG